MGGFLKVKSEIAFFASYILLCMQIPFWNAGIENISFLKIFMYYAGIGVVFLLLCNLMFFAAHLVQSISYGFMGMGLSPVLCYPFVLGADRKHPIQIFSYFFYMAEYFYPRKLFTKTAQEYEDTKVSRICKTAQMNGLIAQIGICIATAVFLVVSQKYFFALAFLVLGLAFLLLAHVDTKTYQGVFALRKYIEKGYLPVYLARQFILYENEEHPVYEKFEAKILQGIPSNLLKNCMETVRHMYMIKCENPDFGFLDKEVVERIEEDFLIHSMKDFQNLECGAEGFDLLKAYLCYAMLNEDSASCRMAVSILERLSQEERQNTWIHADTFYWYYYMAKNCKMLEQKEMLHKNKVLRPNYFFSKFENYKRNYDKISRRMEVLCK